MVIVLFANFENSKFTYFNEVTLKYDGDWFQDGLLGNGHIWFISLIENSS
jgi:hypothetical protein